jgi:alpha-tubulin suppressor-like RCC1 family protein
VLIAGQIPLLANCAAAQSVRAWPVTQVSAGGGHILFTRPDGSLWGLGDNSLGQLGLGPSVTRTNVPTCILTNGVRAIAAGLYHSLFSVGATLWGMGYNNEGELGNGTTNNQFWPVEIFSAAFDRATVFAGGTFHSQFATLNTLGLGGGLWAMGAEYFGELGDGRNAGEAVTKPELVFGVDSGSAALAVAAGKGFGLFLKPDGSLWGMGYNGFGQLGAGSQWEFNTPVRIVSSGVTAVSAGDSHSLFIKSDGSLWAMGADDSGQLGDGRMVPPYQNPQNAPEQIIPGGVTAIAASAEHSLFIKSDGSLWGMGNNLDGQLGDGTSGNRANPVLIVPSGVAAVAAGKYFSLFIRSDGSLWGMGWEGTANLHTPVAIIPAPPLLTVIPYGSNIILLWPSDPAGFQLESATDLTPPVTWSRVSPAPILIGDQYVVINSITAPRMLYRLRL